MIDMTHDTDLAIYLKATRYIDCDHPDVVRHAEAAVGDATSDVDRAVRLFYAVRDSIRYNPYTFSFDPEAYRASLVSHTTTNFCIPKAILLAADARAVGIPSRLGFADVRNHLTTERLRTLIKTDLFVFHGFTDLFLDGRWVKATPAFDLALCRRFAVRPLEFDGRTDALFHEFTPDGRQHMQYVRDRGTFADFPLDEMTVAIREAYGDPDMSTAAKDDAFEHGG
jgi:transglutaminase-like putative cysteine protease